MVPVRALGIASFLLLVAGLGCQRGSQLKVRQVPQPPYPLDARLKGIQGVVRVNVSVGKDGKVTSAQGSGADELLVKSAEENASQWLWGAFPSDTHFPVRQTVTYEYKLQGKTAFVVVPAKVTMHLPDRLEIVATPMASDFPFEGTRPPTP